MQSLVASPSLACILSGQRTSDIELPSGAALHALVAGLNEHQAQVVRASLRTEHYNIAVNGLPGSGKSFLVIALRRMLPLHIKCVMCAQANSMVRRIIGIVIPMHQEFPVLFVGSRKFADPVCLQCTAESQAERACSVVLLSSLLELLHETKNTKSVLDALQSVLDVHHGSTDAPPAHLRGTAGPEGLKVSNPDCISVAQKVLERVLTRRGGCALNVIFYASCG